MIYDILDENDAHVSMSQILIDKMFNLDSFTEYYPSTNF